MTADALTLDLSFNNISVVADGDLTELKLLRVISVRANGLSWIQPLAFDPLWNLEDLDLSENRLMAVDQRWFSALGALRRLNLLNNPYKCLGSPMFQGLVRLRSLAFGGPALEELNRQDLLGVQQLDQLSVHANNLLRYDAGALANIWPLGAVLLKLHGPFEANFGVASALLADVSNPDTQVTLEDLHLAGKPSVQALAEAAGRRIRLLTFRNVSLSDEAVVNFLEVMNGAPLTALSFQDVILTGEGRWERAGWTEHRSIDEFFVSRATVLDVFRFVSLVDMKFLLEYPQKVSLIDSGVFVVPCRTSQLLLRLQYLDLSDNLLTDLTLAEILCDGGPTLSELRVFNVSGNALKSLSAVSRLLATHSRLTHLDVSRNGYSSMPAACPWPSHLRHLNVSGAKLTSVTSCLPESLQVLDLSHNALQTFALLLPALTELHLNGNKLLRLPAGKLLPRLQTLAVQSNALSMFEVSELRSYRRLEFLRAARNTFVCSCDFVSLLQSGLAGCGAVRLADNGVEDAYVCDSPLSLRGEPLAQVRLPAAACHPVLTVSLGCGTVLLCGTLLTILLWRLHAFWYLRMIWAWLGAKRRSQPPDSEALLSYDAFVSYSQQDAGWVENLLVPELEEPRCPQSLYADWQSPPGAPRPLTLCLHKRDFLPGRWIADNIMSAMERSRRTVFILSKSFVQSEWCRYELDFSHFRLMDGGERLDVSILILLEPLSKDDVPKRFCKLRKLMRSTTYLEWPEEEDRRAEFWRSLRDALQGDEQQPVS